MQAVASVPIAEAVTMIEVVPVSMVTAPVLVAAAAVPNFVGEAVAVDPSMVAVKVPAVVVARAGTEIAAFWKTVRKIVAPAEQPGELHSPQALHAPYDHYEYVSKCRAPPGPLRL